MWTNQPANRDMSIVVWPVDAGTGAGDFDVFVSTNPINQLPSTTSYDYKSEEWGSSPELIVVPAHTTQRPIYIAIGSWSGKGQFRFYANSHAPGYPTSVRAITDWNTSPTDRENIRVLLRKMVQAQYFATDGRHFIRNIDIYWNRPGPITLPKPVIVMSGYWTVNQCFGMPPNASHVTLTSMNWCNDTCQPATDPSCVCLSDQSTSQRWAAELPPHELGHCYYGLEDEYHATEACGHSAMADFPLASLNMVDYCDGNNGGKNAPPPRVGHAIGDHNWDVLENSFPSTPPKHSGYTPDAFYETCPRSAGDQPFAKFIAITEH